MKRMVIFIGVLLLILGLSDDGRPGGVRFVAPDSLVNNLEVSSSDSDRKAAGFHEQLCTGNFSSFLQQPSRRLILCPVSKRPAQRILITHFSSAGGLPG
jgi:hypothetical protein